MGIFEVSPTYAPFLFKPWLLVTAVHLGYVCVWSKILPAANILVYGLLFHECVFLSRSAFKHGFALCVKLLTNRCSGLAMLIMSNKTLFMDV